MSDDWEEGSKRRADEDDEDGCDPQLEVSVGAATLAAVQFGAVSYKRSHRDLKVKIFL